MARKKIAEIFKYFVLANGDGYKTKNMEFEDCKYFADRESAQVYAMQHLPAIIAKTGSLKPGEESLVRDRKLPYIVAAEKTIYHRYMGESDGTSVGYEASRCSAKNLEKTIDEITATPTIPKITFFAFCGSICWL